MTDTKAVAVKDDKSLEVRAELKSGGDLHAIIPQDAEQAFRMAQMIVQSGMAPKGMDKPQQVVAAIFHGAEIGLQPMQAVQSIAVINGRPTVWGDAAVGLVQGSGLLKDFEEYIDGEGEAMVAVCRAKRKDNPSQIRREFSVDDAKAAGLWNKTGPWKQYPKRMLQMRARSWVLRDGFADILKGTHIREEVMDYGHPAATAIESETPVANAQALRDQAQIASAPAPETERENPAPSDEDEKQPESEPDAETTAAPEFTINRVHGAPAQYKSIETWGKAMKTIITDTTLPEGLHEFWQINAENIAAYQQDSVNAPQIAEVSIEYGGQSAKLAARPADDGKLV